MKKILAALLPLSLFAMQNHPQEKIVLKVFKGGEFLFTGKAGYAEAVMNSDVVNKTFFNPNAYSNKKGRVKPIHHAAILPLVRDCYGKLHAIFMMDEESMCKLVPDDKSFDYQHAVEIACQAKWLQPLDPTVFNPAKIETEIHETGCELPDDRLVNRGCGCMIYATIINKTTAESMRSLATEKSNNKIKLVPFCNLLGAISRAQTDAYINGISTDDPVKVEGYQCTISGSFARTLARRLDRLKALE